MFKTFLFLFFFVVSGNFGTAENIKRISVTGSTTVLPIIQESSEIFSKRENGVRVSVRGGGSKVGIASLIDKTTDIAISSRELDSGELTLAEKKGVVTEKNVLALDAVIIIVHPSNPVESLTKRQVKDIFAGRIRNWSEVGGLNSDIILISRDSPSGTFGIFNNMVMNGERIMPEALMLLSNKHVINTSLRSLDSIGYISVSYRDNGVKTLKIDGIEPTGENMRSGIYPLTRKLFAYTTKPAPKQVELFMQFLLGEDGKKISERLGFVVAE